MPCPFTFSRRTFLTGAAAASAALGAQATAQGISARSRDAGTPRSDHSHTNDPDARLEFHGDHQQGIVNQPQKYAEVVALDLQCTGKQRLEQLLRTITDRARALTAGGATPPDGIAFPAGDSGELGPELPTDNCLLYTSDAADE